MPEKTLTLRVADAYQRDVGRGIARVDPKVVDELGLTSGDVIQIVGKKKTTALSWPGYESDHGKGTIRIDGYLRNNAGVSIDDKVTIRKIEAKIAQRVTLAPTEPLRIVGGEEYLSQILEGRVLARGDYVPISVMGRKIDLVVTSTTPTAEAVIVTDEIDSIAPKREEVTGEVEKRVVSQLLSVMDGLQSRGKVVVIGATNRINSIDPALRRPGRFDREIEIGVPDRDGRLEILQIHTRGMPLEDVDLKKLADVTHGFVGADLEALAKEAAIRALRRILPEINLEAQSIPGDILNKIIVKMSDFLDALKEIEPSAMP